MRTSDRKNKRKIGLVISILVLLAVIVYLIGSYVNRYNERQFNQDLAEEVRMETVYATEVSEPDVIEENEEEIAEEPESEIEAVSVDVPIDFETLWEINEDVHAWLSIPGMDLEYPILQSDESDVWQEFYLNHTIERVPSEAGSIFTQHYNAKDFFDQVTFVYGHDMADGSMFGRLRNFWSADFMAAHPYIVIYTPTNIFTYEIFAAVTYDDYHILYYTDFENADEFQAFLDNIRNFRSLNRLWNEAVEVSTNDRLLILSTCVDRSDHRLLVGAVLVDEQ
ncbi:MAG: class B sortase [Lachnospiraceae bacterium]|nr:class B sortase [Lachnospiraceae bacterium]